MRLSSYKDLLAEYDDIIIGKKTEFSHFYFSKSDSFTEKNAMAVLQYAFENYLHWTPEAIAEDLTDDIVKKMHLDKVIKKVRFPVEYNNEKDYYYLATLLYPQFGLNMHDRTIHIYERVLSGEAGKFPKGYFFGSDGAVRAGICLQYMITNYVTFSNMNELYHIFGTDGGYQYLKKYCLLQACRELFRTPIDYLHFSIATEQKSDFFYHFYRFKYMREMVNDQDKLQHRKKTYLLQIPTGRTQVIEKELSERFGNLNEVYHFFTTDAGHTAMMDHAEKDYDTPVDFIFDAIPDEWKDGFLYRYYKFRYLKGDRNSESYMLKIPDEKERRTYDNQNVRAEIRA